MPALNITKNYADAAVLTKAHLDDAFDSVSTLLNTTKLDADNIQTGGISTALIAVGGVTTDRIAAQAVTNVKIADANVTTVKIADANVTTAKLVDSCVTADKIADGAVVRTKQGAVGQQISPTCGIVSTTSSSPVAVTNLSCTITTTGRPVIVGIMPDSTTSPAYFNLLVNSATVDHYGQVTIKRGSTEIAPFTFGDISSPTIRLRVPASLTVIDLPGVAGTYTYTVTINNNSTADTPTMTIANCVLFAYEL